MKKILHIIAQQPGKTGSGIYIQSIINEAAKKKYQQAVIMGIPENSIIDFDQELETFPVFFETPQLPFPVVGMSDIMPYKSTKYSDLTEKMFNQWKESFSEIIKKAVETFQPDIIISHHLWILTSFVKKLFPKIKIISIAHGTGIRQMNLAPQYSDFVINHLKEIDLVLALNDYQKHLICNTYELDEKKIVVTGVAYNDSYFPPFGYLDYF